MHRRIKIKLSSIFLSIGFAALPLSAQTAEPKDSPAQGAVPAASVRYPLDAFPEFSAVMVGSRVEAGEGTTEGHIYRSGKLMRMEDPGRRGYFITDLATSETYGISEMGCMHDSHPFVRSIPFASASKPDVTLAKSPAGKETVDGHPCQIENITLSSPRFANPLKMKFWEAEDLQGFPIRIAISLPGGHDSIIRYKNVVLGPQDSTLFLHPKSCEELRSQN